MKLSTNIFFYFSFFFISIFYYIIIILLQRQGAFLGMFALVAESAYWLCHISPFICLHVQPGSHWTDFHEILYWRLSRKLANNMEI